MGAEPRAVDSPMGVPLLVVDVLALLIVVDGVQTQVRPVSDAVEMPLASEMMLLQLLYILYLLLVWKLW